jgi:hypothetical protein
MDFSAINMRNPIPKLNQNAQNTRNQIRVEYSRKNNICAKKEISAILKKTPEIDQDDLEIQSIFAEDIRTNMVKIPKLPTTPYSVPALEAGTQVYGNILSIPLLVVSYAKLEIFEIKGLAFSMIPFKSSVPMLSGTVTKVVKRAAESTDTAFIRLVLMFIVKSSCKRLEGSIKIP